MPGIDISCTATFLFLKGGFIIQQFVELTSTNAARIFGLHPRKGTIAIGSDADIAIWNPDREVQITETSAHDNMDYSPFAGMNIKGWPELVVNWGRIIIDNGELKAVKRQGEFLRRKPFETTGYISHLPPELDVNESRRGNYIVRDCHFGFWFQE